ncbi:HNH endonuclease [Photobacterium atrarenae]|uniref:HNH endonuclease n=1 Tax=Photobacterium atrarenae TaxID=865757 RepID=A0ABY5GMJ7_9GAMM|nr:HNH endonuclease [Photobacterium atrarenae]UTV30153.1 HNH endonuclease [Photobacterium atrarenae]
MAYNCLYQLDGCKGNVGSEEHSILKALGGRFKSKQICCEICNNKLGKEIDNVLTDNLKEVCVLNQIIREDGVRPVVEGITAVDGLSVDLTYEGFRLSKVATAIEKLSSKCEHIQVVGDLKRKEAVLQRFEQLKGQKAYQGAEYEGEELQESVKQVAFKRTWSFSFSKNELRSIAKTALTELARNVAPKRLRTGQFEQVIDFIKGQDNADGLVRYFKRTCIPHTEILGHLQHSTFTICLPEGGCYGIVCLFGTFAFCVKLSDSWDGPVLYKASLIDPSSEDHKIDKLDWSEHLSTLYAQQSMKLLLERGASLSVTYSSDDLARLVCASDVIKGIRFS